MELKNLLKVPFLDELMQMEIPVRLVGEGLVVPGVCEGELFLTFADERIIFEKGFRKHTITSIYDLVWVQDQERNGREPNATWKSLLMDWGLLGETAKS